MEFTQHGEEGDVIDIYAELVVIEGGLKRPLLVATTILSGTADCKKFEFCTHSYDEYGFVVPMHSHFISRWH